MSKIRAVALSAVAGASAALVTANVALAEGRFGGGYRGHRGGQFRFFLPLLILIALGVILALLWRGRHPSAPAATAPPSAPPPASPTFNAQAILADRLARGEISPDDYRAAIDVLRETPVSPPPPASPG
jgi:uncharacterized membrane protein